MAEPSPGRAEGWSETNRANALARWPIALALEAPTVAPQPVVGGGPR